MEIINLLQSALSDPWSLLFLAVGWAGISRHIPP